MVYKTYFWTFHTLSELIKRTKFNCHQWKKDSG